MLRCGPGFPVDARSLSASIFSDLTNRKCLAARRANQQLLQTFCVAPVTVPYCLRYASLQPPNRSINAGPVETVPVLPNAGGEIACTCVHLNLRGEMERATGIEPVLAAWEAAVLPLNYARPDQEPIGGAGTPVTGSIASPQGLEPVANLSSDRPPAGSLRACAPGQSFHPLCGRLQPPFACSGILYLLWHGRPSRAILSASDATKGLPRSARVTGFARTLPIRR